MLRDKMAPIADLDPGVHCCELGQRYGDASTAEPCLVIDGTVEPPKPFHARARRRDQQDLWLSEVQILQELLLDIRLHEVEAYDDVEVWSCFPSSTYQKLSCTTSFSAQLCHIVSYDPNMGV